MEIRTPPKVERFVTLKRVEPLVLSQSAIRTFKECPRKYFWSWVLGYKPTNTPPYFAFGRAYHKFREVLDNKALEAGTHKDPKLFPAAMLEAHKLWQKEKPPAPAVNDYRAKKWEFLNDNRLIEACKAAYDWWYKDQESGAFKTIHIETPFTFQVREGENRNGRWDKVLKWNNALWIMDHKTSSKDRKYFERGIEPNEQADSYIYALQQTTNQTVKGVMFEVMHQDKSKKPNMYRVMTSRTEGQIKSWLREQDYWLDALAYARNNDQYPMNDTACTFCDYHIVCKGMNENMQTSVLKGNLFKFAPYDNMAET